MNIDGYLTTPRIQEVRALPLVAQRSAEWFKLRGDRITGSIADTLLGTNPYEGPAGLVAQKAGVKSTFRGNAFTAHGTKFEPVAIGKYTDRTGRKLIELGLVAHPVRSDLAHSPDGVVLHPRLPPRLLEVKCPATRKIVPGKVPPQYTHQIQLGLEVFDLEECDFVQYKPADGEFPEILDITTVKRDPSWLARNSPRFAAFWRAVQAYRNHVMPLIEELKTTPAFDLV